ncbi:MAG: hypothetical protein ACRDRM_09045, partial [Pseudonocardiaceae bacterium]
PFTGQLDSTTTELGRVGSRHDGILPGGGGHLRSGVRAQGGSSLARAEMWAATAAERPDHTPPPLERICADLGVAFWRPGAVDSRWATGVRATLHWLLGTEGQQAPTELPVRRVDGTTPSAEELYEVAVAATPFLFELPEQCAP